MSKQIIFAFLLIANTITYGMKRPSTVFHNNGMGDPSIILLDDGLRSHITTQICTNKKYSLDDVKKTIGVLTLTHSSLRNYYAQEKTQQTIIDFCSFQYNFDTKSIARHLQYHTVAKKIEELTDIARDKTQQFSTNDLKDPWYLAATTLHVLDYNIYQEPSRQSLLDIALRHWNLEKAIIILNNTKKLYFNYNQEYNPLLKVTSHRSMLLGNPEALFHQGNFSQQQCESYLKKVEKELEQLMIIARGLLEKGILPDGREKDTQFTPLLYSVKCADTELTQLLLESNADPRLIKKNAYTWKKEYNAFDLEPEEGWLQAIIDKVKKNKNNL